jgi:hypothetical protein
MIFQDEVDLTLQVPIKRQNNRFCANTTKSNVSPERLYHGTSTFSKKIMVCAAVCFHGKSDLILIDPQHFIALCRVLYFLHHFIFKKILNKSLCIKICKKKWNYHFKIYFLVFFHFKHIIRFWLYFIIAFSVETFNYFVLFLF